MDTEQDGEVPRASLASGRRVTNLYGLENDHLRRRMQNRHKAATKDFPPRMILKTKQYAQMREVRPLSLNSADKVIEARRTFRLVQH